MKKVHFEAYRFSEDLDFSLLDNEITNEQIFEWFEEVFEYILDEANIPLEIIDNNQHEDGGINFYISYVGPLGGVGANKRVKVDISRSEELQFEPVLQSTYLGYSDQEDHQLLCYPLEEVLVEKLRSIVQRMQARDLYDIWYLLEVHEMDITFYANELKAKCKIKDIDREGFHEKLGQRLPQYQACWQRSMLDQIRDLPDFETVQREVMRHLKKLEV